MDTQVLSNAIEYVKAFFENDASGHDFYHTERVYKTAVKLAEKEGADVGITALAALLHDVDDRKLSPETHLNYDNARRFMTENGVDGETQNKVIDIISNVSYVGENSPVPDSLEGKCVQDADRLDAIGAIGIARAFAYGGSHGRSMYDPSVKPERFTDEAQYFGNKNSTSINHFYEKLFLLKDLLNTRTAITIAEKRDEFMHTFIDEFLLEWDGTDV